MKPDFTDEGFENIGLRSPQAACLRKFELSKCDLTSVRTPSTNKEEVSWREPEVKRLQVYKTRQHNN